MEVHALGRFNIFYDANSELLQNFNGKLLHTRRYNKKLPIASSEQLFVDKQLTDSLEIITGPRAHLDLKQRWCRATNRK